MSALGLLTRYGLSSPGGSPPPGPGLPSDPDGIWLESLFLTGLSHGDDVTEWPDASAAGYDLEPVATPPKLHLPANGAPTIRGGGLAVLTGAGAFYNNNTEPFTAFLVTSAPPPRADTVLASVRPASGTHWTWFWETTGPVFYSTATLDDSLQFGGNLDDAALRVLSIRFAPALTGTDRFRGYVNKTLVDQEDASTVVASGNPLTVLGEYSGSVESARFHGEIAALLWYRSALNDNDHEAVIDYLTDRYVTPQVPETAFRYYRLWIAARDGSSNTTVKELTLHETSGGSNFATNHTGASANSVFSGTYPAAAAFDGNPATQWYSTTSSPPHWLRADFSTPHPLEKYTIMGDAAGSPSSWTLEGSNDGLYWTPLDTVTGETGWSANEVREFFI